MRNWLIISYEKCFGLGYEKCLGRGLYIYLKGRDLQPKRLFFTHPLFVKSLITSILGFLLKVYL